jgi:hypothetical protein
MFLSKRRLASVAATLALAGTACAGLGTPAGAQATRAAPPLGTGNGLFGQYYDDSNLTDLHATRTDGTVDFDWGYGSPHWSIGPNTFSARWSGMIEPQFSETYTFHVTVNDGVRLWVNGTQVINEWRIQNQQEFSTTPIALVAGNQYSVRMEFFEFVDRAMARLEWSSPSTPRQVVPRTQLYSCPDETDALPTLSSWGCPQGGGSTI